MHVHPSTPVGAGLPCIFAIGSPRHPLLRLASLHVFHFTVFPDPISFSPAPLLLLSSLGFPLRIPLQTGRKQCENADVSQPVLPHVSLCIRCQVTTGFPFSSHTRASASSLPSILLILFASFERETSEKTRSSEAVCSIFPFGTSLSDSRGSRVHELEWRSHSPS